MRSGEGQQDRPATFEESYEVPEIKWDIEAISDWGYRIQNYSGEQKQFYMDMVPKINELKGVGESANLWDLLVDSKKDEVIIETKKSIRGLLIMRAKGVVEWPPMDVFRAMNYSPMIKEWNLNHEESEFLKKVGVNGFHYWSKTKKVFVVSSRDFATNMLYNVEADGTVIICGSSDNFHGDCPEKPGAVRGLTPLSGYILRPVASDPSKTHITMINEVDLKGSIP
jgi:hypothetical protein